MTRRARLDEAEAIAEVWLRSRAASVPRIPPPVHSDDEVRRWFTDVVLPSREVWIEEVAGEVAAMMVLEGEWIDQLYVDPDHTGTGLGSRLMEVAKHQQPSGLRLWTFQANSGARRFYERHGFVAAAQTDGDNEEHAPDVRYEWNGDGVRSRLRRVEHLLDPGLHLIEDAGEQLLLPAWRRVTDGEPRWPVSLAIVLAIAMQGALPRNVAVHPRLLLPGLEVLLLIGLVTANPRRIVRESPRLRVATVTLIGVISAENAWSAGKLILHLLRGDEGQSPTGLLMTGAAIWLTNIIAFALWYWELDRGGPVGRAHGARPHPDFAFVQMQSPELAPPNWESGFADYLYLSFTNAAAFSPTDVLPLTRWAKLTMMVQSIVSLSTVALVIARAVNILK